MSMATMHPVVLLGAYGLDHDRMPADEFQIRMGQANALMDDNGWRALFVYGDATEHRALAWLTNFIPRMRWAFAMLPRDGEPRLLISIGARDMPAMRLMTWIAEVHPGWSWPETFDPWLAAFLESQPHAAVAVGLLGRDLMRAPFVGMLNDSLAGTVSLAPADAAFEPVLHARRPREVAMIREACRLVDEAAAAMESAWRGGANAMKAAIEAERCARAQAAHDVRVLFSTDGGATLVPFFGVVEGRPDPLLAYIAVKYAGYWADAFVTFADRPSDALAGAQAALDKLLGAVRPGSRAGALAAAARIEGRPAHPVLGGCLGHRIGLSLAEPPDLKPEGEAVLEPGGIYTLRVGTADPERGCALLSAMVCIGEDRVEILRRSGRS